MSNNKQSSVEILEDFLLQHCNPTICNVEWSDFKLAIEQAKAMHKVEIVNAVDGFPIHTRHMDGEEYHNEIFGGNNE